MEVREADRCRTNLKMVLLYFIEKYYKLLFTMILKPLKFFLLNINLIFYYKC